MRRYLSYSMLLILTVSALMACHQSHKKELEVAYAMAGTNPDSALSLLNHIDQGQLVEEEMAKYALFYYMAQDKSGLDVDNDSLIRMAFNWYDKHQEDTLYATSLYYMGKCFMLNDSMEQAAACMERSYAISNSLQNMNVKCLALDKLIEIEEQLSPYKALNDAKDLVKMYDAMPDASTYNKVAAHLRLGENFNYVDSLEQALEETRKAYRLAMHAGDKSLLSYTSQDMSNVFNDLGEKDSCLYYARQAYEQTDTDRFSCLLTLASAYISTDSAKQAFALLRQAIPKTAEDRYSVFYMQSLAATGASNFKLGKALGDSANRCLQEMYRTASQAKMTHYSSLLKKESERAKMQGKTEMQQWVFGLTVLLCLAIVSFIAYAYWTYRKRTQFHLIHEQEMYSLKREMTEKLHQEELTHKNVQLTVMRGYLQKKIEIVEKLYSIVPAKGKRVVLSENDWAELETFLNCVEDLFVSRLKQRHPNLSKSDLHLMMLLRLKIPQKTLASIYCISEKAVKQKLFLYKDKVGIKNEHFSLRNYIENF